MLTPIFEQHERRLRRMTNEQLEVELHRLQNPSTTNRITLFVMKGEIEIIHAIAKERRERKTDDDL